MKERYNIVQSTPEIVPEIITLHWTVIPTFEETWETFDIETCTDRPDICKYGKVNVSS